MAGTCHERADGGVDTVRGRLGHDGDTTMAFLETFESSQRAMLLSSSTGRSGAARESFGEGELWHRYTSKAVVTRTSTRTTSEEQLVNSGRGHQRGHKRDRSAESPHASERTGSFHRVSAADRCVAGGHGGAADTQNRT